MYEYIYIYIYMYKYIYKYKYIYIYIWGMAWSLHGLHGMPQGFWHLNGKLWYGKPPRL